MKFTNLFFLILGSHKSLFFFHEQIEEMSGRFTFYSETINPIGVGNENVFIQGLITNR